MKKYLKTIILLIIIIFQIQGSAATVITNPTGNMDSSTQGGLTGIPSSAGYNTNSNVMLGGGDNSGVLGAGIGAPNPYDSKNINKAEVDKRIRQSILTSTSSTASTTNNGVVGKTMGNVAGCGAGILASNMIAGSISKAVGDVGNKVIEGVVENIAYVPVAEKGLVGENIKAQTSASVGTVVGTGGISSIQGASWDGVAWCIVNAMIAYIADSTIEWINTGFDGNPAFLNNPDMFFKQLADEEAASFVQNLAYGVTGANVCDVFRSAMVNNILNQYSQQQGYGYGYDNGGYYNPGISNGFMGCSFDQNPGQLNSFMQGNFIQGGGWNSWYQVTQTPQNNPFDTYFRTNDQLANRLVTTQASQARDLNWNNGWLNYKKCKDPKDKNSCVTVSPGSLIQSQLESTLKIPKDRLAFTQKFDQVVTVLVDRLISTALSDVLGSGQQGYSY